MGQIDSALVQINKLRRISAVVELAPLMREDLSWNPGGGRGHFIGLEITSLR